MFNFSIHIIYCSMLLSHNVCLHSQWCGNLVSGDMQATESQEVMNSGLDDFTRELSVDDSRMIVDLLKIAAAGRLQPSTQNILSSLLNSLAKSNPLVAVPLFTKLAKPRVFYHVIG